MKTFEKLESLGFFDWLSESHNIRDTDMKPEYLDELPLNDIHRTVANSMAFRWFRKKYNLVHRIDRDGGWWVCVILNLYDEEDQGTIEIYLENCYPNSYEEAELACLIKLIEIVKK